MEIIWHLTTIEKKLVKNNTLPPTYVGTPLPEIKVAWHQNKQGRGKNKAEKDLSMNRRPSFQENGCLVCTVEASEGSWPCLGPLWEHFHKTGLPTIMCIHKSVEIEMKDGSKPAHKFTDLCREISFFVDAVGDQLFNALIPVESDDNNTPAATLVKKMKHYVAGWFLDTGVK